MYNEITMKTGFASLIALIGYKRTPTFACIVQYYKDYVTDDLPVHF